MGDSARLSNSQRLVYIPKKVLETLGHSLTIMPEMNAAVLCPTGANPETLAKPVELILQDLRIRIESKRTK